MHGSGARVHGDGVRRSDEVGKILLEAAWLTNVDQFEQVYLEQILPEKLRLNLQYVDQGNILTDMRIIFATLFLLVNPRKG